MPVGRLCGRVCSKLSFCIIKVMKISSCKIMHPRKILSWAIKICSIHNNCPIRYDRFTPKIKNHEVVKQQHRSSCRSRNLRVGFYCLQKKGKYNIFADQIHSYINKGFPDIKETDEFNSFFSKFANNWVERIETDTPTYFSGY